METIHPHDINTVMDGQKHHDMCSRLNWNASSMKNQTLGLSEQPAYVMVLFSAELLEPTPLLTSYLTIFEEVRVPDRCFLAL